MPASQPTVTAPEVSTDGVEFEVEELSDEEQDAEILALHEPYFDSPNSIILWSLYDD